MITVGYRWSGAIVDLDRVHMLGVKSGVSLYGRDRVVRSRVGPHRVRGNTVTQLEVEVGGITLVRAVRRVIRVMQHRWVDVSERDVLHRRVGRLLQRQRVDGVGDDLSGDGHGDPCAGGLDGDGMVRSWQQDLLVGHARLQHLDDGAHSGPVPSGVGARAEVPTVVVAGAVTVVVAPVTAWAPGLGASDREVLTDLHRQLLSASGDDMGLVDPVGVVSTRWIVAFGYFAVAAARTF